MKRCAAVVRFHINQTIMVLSSVSRASVLHAEGQGGGTSRTNQCGVQDKVWVPHPSLQAKGGGRMNGGFFISEYHTPLSRGLSRRAGTRSTAARECFIPRRFAQAKARGSGGRESWRHDVRLAWRGRGLLGRRSMRGEHRLARILPHAARSDAAAKDPRRPGPYAPSSVCVHTRMRGTPGQCAPPDDR